MKPEMMDKEWQVQDDLRIMSQARKIQGDPKRMAAVKELAKKQLEDLKALSK